MAVKVDHAFTQDGVQLGQNLLFVKHFASIFYAVVLANSGADIVGQFAKAHVFLERIS